MNCDPGLADINVDVLWLPNLVPRVLDVDTVHRHGSLEVCEDINVAYTHVACVTTTKKLPQSVVDPTPLLHLGLASGGSGVPSGAVAVCGVDTNGGESFQR